ncbi:MAG TPA: hypothetical protein H9875_08275 [Candidatus Levilactobacillus faecigallinarum]|uniref:Uncharacterized protein n=1 Tax=Candidatus Levilactobacillus faecigallinarum TaxID=2838638 RepID=A0A9D1QT55_9LACO|nr:hypothetical protein [Candidatus Levilactobacillus faecigallinarum]
MEMRERVEWTLAHLGDDPYVLARRAGVPVRVVTDLIWGHIQIDDLRLADAERLARLCRQQSQQP